MIYDFDGYDDYPTAQLLREHVRKAGTPTIGSGGRFGGNRLACAGRSQYVCRAVPASPPGSLTIGAWFEVSSLSGYVHLVDFRDATHSQTYLVIESDGAVSAYRSTNPTEDYGGSLQSAWRVLLGTSSAGAVVAGTPFGLQAALTVSDTAGTIEVRINGVPVLALEDQDTRTNTAGISNVLIGNGNTPGGGADATVYVDDLWLADDFLGDRRVDSHYPTDDGTLQDGMPSTPGDHCEMVDETEPDDDTTYVSLDAAAESESYDVESFKNAGAAIDAVLVAADARRDEAGEATLTGLVYKGAAYAGSAEALGTDYSRVRTIFEVDPSTTNPWDHTAFNAAEFGYRKVS